MSIGFVIGLAVVVLVGAAAAFFVIKNFGVTEERERTQAEILADIEAANRKANRDAEEIANMSRADKRDELSK